jgi:N-acetylmuramoyl-L-alanine amidase
MAKIGLDIGHGSNTYEVIRGKGVVVNGVVYEEHTFNSKVAIVLEKLLLVQGHKVFKAQQPFENDVSLTKRTDYYNSLNLDLIISIHANAASPSARGMCAFYWGSSSKGKQVADLYAKYVKEYDYIQYSEGTYSSRTNHWSNFHMLRETEAVCILTENNFMTNPEDFKLIFQSEEYVQHVAEIHARTVAEYFKDKYVDLIPKQEEVKIEEEDEMLEKAIVINSFADFPSAEGLAHKLQAPIYLKSIAKSKQVAKEIYICGGTEEGIKGEKFTMLSGADRYETAAKIGEFLKK